MALKGAEIKNMLPDGGKKNCKECGFPTCFAFAMKLASGAITLDKCPHLDPAVKAELEEAMAPPQKLVAIGTGDNALNIGNEEVLYRHDKTFVNACGFALAISDNDSDDLVDQKIQKIKDLEFERVGLTLKANLLAPVFESGNKDKFVALVKKIAEKSDRGMVIISEDTDALFAARDAVADKKPLIYPITKDNIDKAIPEIKKSPTPVGVRAANVEELIPLTEKLKAEGIDNCVLDSGARKTQDLIKDQTFMRRAALKQGERSLGYPTIAFPCMMTKDKMEEVVIASVALVKYAGIIVLSDMTKETLQPLLVQRLNIYTDPRMPMTVEEKIYEIGEPTEDSPVLISTNWALTYFIVSSEIEGAKVPVHLLVKDAEGLGVLTAWAAGKFNGDNIGPFVKNSGIESKVKNKKLVLPGKVARIKGEVEDALPGWEIVVGPREASGITGWLPDYASSLKS
jgi:acetyl-CoA decarbonylase/synthase complex subunit gamma